MDPDVTALLFVQQWLDERGYREGESASSDYDGLEHHSAW
jgi:hypothetical protein